MWESQEESSRRPESPPKKPWWPRMELDRSPHRILSACPSRVESRQPHHHFVPAYEVGGLAEQLHIRHCDGARLLPDQHGVVQLYIAPSHGRDQVLALHGQESPSSHPRVRSTATGWLTCPPTWRSHPSGELVERPPSLISPKNSQHLYYYSPFLSGKSIIKALFSACPKGSFRILLNTELSSVTTSCFKLSHELKLIFYPCSKEAL